MHNVRPAFVLLFVVAPLRMLVAGKLVPVHTSDIANRGSETVEMIHTAPGSDTAQELLRPWRESKCTPGRAFTNNGEIWQESRRNCGQQLNIEDRQSMSKHLSSFEGKALLTQAMPASAEGGGGGYPRPNTSDSTLSTVGGMGLEDLAAYVRGSSLNGWDDQQHQERRQDDDDDGCQKCHQPRQSSTLHSPLPLVNTNKPLSGPTSRPLNHDYIGSSSRDSIFTTGNRSTTMPRAAGQSEAQESPVLSAAQSIAELVVRSVTESVLQRSASNTSSILRVNTGRHKTGAGPARGGKDANVVEGDVPAALVAANTEEQVAAPEPFLPFHTKTVAELVVRHVTTLGLHHSTSDILKTTRNDAPVLVTSDEHGTGARSGAKIAKGNAITDLHAPDDNTPVKVRRNTPTPCSTELLVVEREEQVADRRVAASERATSEGTTKERPLPTNHTKKPIMDRADSRADGRSDSADGQGDYVEVQEQKMKTVNAADYAGRGNDDDNEFTLDAVVTLRGDTREDKGWTEIEEGRMAKVSQGNRVGKRSSGTLKEQDVLAKDASSDNIIGRSSDGGDAPQRWRSQQGTAKAIIAAFCSPPCQRVPAPIGNPAGDERAKCPARYRQRADEIRKGFGEPRPIEAVPHFHEGHSRSSALYTSCGRSKETASGSAARAYTRLGSHREAVRASLSQSPALAEAAASTSKGDRPPHSERSTAISVETSHAGDHSVDGSTSPGGAVVGLAGLHRDVVSWLNGEVLVPSAARVVAYMSKNGGTRPSSPNSPTAQSARSAVPSLDDSGGSTKIFGGRNSHSGNEAAINQTRHPSYSCPDEDVDLYVHDGDGPTTTGRWGHMNHGFATAEPLRQAVIDRKRRAFHPAQLFHLLWQRDRYRCPFSSCPIPDTVIFDSMGEAVDWYFTSKREGGIKRKFTSNTRLSNIFQEFSKGSGEEGDAVAVLIFWTRKMERSDGSPTEENRTGRRVYVRGGTPYQPQQDFERRNDISEQNRRHHPQHQQGTAIRHLTARELHSFLFGADHDDHKLPRAATYHPSTEEAAKERTWAETYPLLETTTVADDYNRTRPHHGHRVPTVPGSYGGVELKRPHAEISVPPHSERSNSAARAAGADAGDDGDGGWCLLQKFIEPAGSKISTLRCDWTASPSQRSQYPNTLAAAHVAVDASPAAGDRDRPRWGSVEEVETSFREGSPLRSPFRERQLDDDTKCIPDHPRHRLPTSYQSAKGTTGCQYGTAGAISTFGGVSEGCVLQRCTNIFRADRRDLTCEDRCVTFEEPTPSSRGGLWPRSEKGPVRSSLLRQTLVEACSAISDHVSQVTKDAFRMKAATAFFRQGVDGRTFLMFLSSWGASSAPGVDQSEPVLARAGQYVVANHGGHERQARCQHKIGPPNEQRHTQIVEGRPRRPPELGGEGGGEGELQSRSIADFHALVCPGCGCPGVRGGVRRIDGESNRRDKASTRGGTARRDGLTVSEGVDSGEVREIPQGSAGSCRAVSKGCPWPESSSRESSASMTSTTVSGTFHTSLGVIVDICDTWRSPSDANETEVDHVDHANAPRGSVRTPAGIARCLRVLRRIHPGVDAETVAERCKEDLRLRLRGISVCRECAVEISSASDARLRVLDDAARKKMTKLAGRLGIISGEPSLSVRQRKARVMKDIKAFHRRLTSASSASSRARTHRHCCFGGGPSRMGASPCNLSGHLPSRPLGSNFVRPRTTDGISPRQQYHTSRRIVSATTPSDGWDCSSDSHGEVRQAVKASPHKNNGGGRNEAVKGGNLFSSSRAAGDNSISSGGDCDDGLVDLRGGFAVCSTEGEGAEPRNHTGIFQDGHERYTAAPQQQQQQQQHHHHHHQHHQHHQHRSPPHQQTHQSCDEKGISELNERSFYTPAGKAFRCRRLVDTYGGRARREYGERGVSPGRVDNGRPAQSATPVREQLQHHPRPVSRLTHGPHSARTPRSAGTGRCRRGGRSNRYRSSSDSPSTSSSKALQWAKAVSTKGVERRSSAPPPKPSCPPRQHSIDGLEGVSRGLEDDEAYVFGGESGAWSRSPGNMNETEEDTTAGGRTRGGGTRASTGGDLHVDWAHSTLQDSAGDSRTCCSGVNKCSQAVAASGDGVHDGGYVSDGYSDASFAVDDENDNNASQTEKHSGDSPRKFEFGGYAESDAVAVDAIPSMLVETGR